MTDGPIDLDGRRTAAEKLNSVLRRQPANADLSSDERDKQATDEWTHAGPARPPVEALETAIFLLALYAATAEAQDVRIQKLIKITVADLARLKKHKENDS